MPKWKLVSADSHISEVPGTWDLVQSKYGDRAPRVVIDPREGMLGAYVHIPEWRVGRDGGTYESCAAEYIGLERREINGTLGTGRVLRTGGSERTAEFRNKFRFEDYTGPWDPEARKRDMARDNVEFEVLYASHLRHMYEIGLDDEPFFHAICESYNQWLMDFCSYDPKHFIGLPALSPLNPESAAADIRHYVSMGAKGFMSASAVPVGTSYGDSKFDPIWEAAQEVDVPLGMHIASGRWKVPSYHHSRQAAALQRAVSNVGEIQTTIGEMIEGGVFERFPRLKIVAAEWDAGWIPYWVSQMRLRAGDTGVVDCFDRNIWFTFQDDRVGSFGSQLYGADRFLWASDYPHSTTTWPDSAAIVDDMFSGVPEDVKLKVTRQNTIDLYKLDA